MLAEPIAPRLGPDGDGFQCLRSRPSQSGISLLPGALLPPLPLYALCSDHTGLIVPRKHRDLQLEQGAGPPGGTGITVTPFGWEGELWEDTAAAGVAPQGIEEKRHTLAASSLPPSVSHECLPLAEPRNPRALGNSLQDPAPALESRAGKG